MLIREYLKTRKDGVKLFRTYSDMNYYIIKEQTGEYCEEAIDVEDAPFTYIETDEEIKHEEEEVA